MSRIFAVVLTLCLTTPWLCAADAKLTAEQTKFFENKIRPVLVKHCESCHTASTPKGPKGGLTLDTRDGLLKGGDTGPAVVPNNLKKSLIIKALKGEDLSQMPPKEKLSADVIADFEKWIGMGAPDPRDGKARTTAPKIDIEKGKEHWAFQPVKTPTVPSGSTWATTPIDQFIAAKHTELNVKPVADADARTLARRAYYDLIGLPPTPEQLDEFLKDKTPQAFEKLIDKLLASPQFGEKWGRHWLDVARYAESSGKDRNTVFPFAWRYRDYVIDSFNKDKPINQFFIEQLAGDLLPHKDDNQKAEHTVATGYLALGTKSVDERNRKQFEMDVADEQIDAFSQGMLGLTIACARCHDHKFDPIPTKDYYSVAGIFLSTETQFGLAAGIQARQASSLAELPKSCDLPSGPVLTTREVEKLREKLTELKKEADDLREADRKAGAQPVRILFVLQQMAIVERQIGYYEKDGTAKKMAMATKDRTFPKDTKVMIRGDIEKPGETAPRGVVQVLKSDNFKITKGESGRKDLADWVASDKNPLTARVYVNRVWQQLFGAGLVTTPDNFGTMGQKPSHPELLDYLASTFTKSGWSNKQLIKTLMLSRTYRMSSETNAANYGTDPDNVGLWRMSKRRLSAEAIRDSMLAIAGVLDTSKPNGSPTQKFEGNIAQLQRYGFGSMTDFYETKHRSVYMPVIRDSVPESLDLFDFAEPSLVNGKRDDTSVPAQALYLMNNTAVLKLADAAAKQTERRNASDTERIDLSFRTVLGRTPTVKEASAAEVYLGKIRAMEAKSGKKKSDVERIAWGSLVQALFGTAEFRYLD
jgi:Protein of unknown function (DUF1553)/Protein of unknown function (DUF1549)/Planctomycete cytochrome C